MGEFNSLHGQYSELSNSSLSFSFANQSAVVSGAGLSTTVSTVVLSNPISSLKNLILWFAGWAFSAPPAATSPVWLATGFNATTNVTHTTPGVVQNGLIGATVSNVAGVAGVGLIDTSATLPTAPVINVPLIGGGAAAAFPVPACIVVPLNGSIVLPPGGYATIQMLTTATGFGYIAWAQSDP